MTEQALLLVNLFASLHGRRRCAPLPQPVPDGPVRGRSAVSLRRLLVSMILIKRPEQSAHAYASIWWPEGSPLVVLSRRLQEAVKPHWTKGPVELAMRYGEPSIEGALKRPPGRASPRWPSHRSIRSLPTAPRRPSSRKRAGSSASTGWISAVDPAALLRSAGIPRRAGGQRHAAPAAGLRSSAAELPRAAGAAPAQVRPDRRALSEG